MLNSDEKRFAIEDARMRQEARVELLYAADQQSMSLLSLYVTLGLATASGFVFCIAPTSKLPLGLALALFAATLSLLVGAVFCFRAVETAEISLPGRNADFWIWADDPKITFDDVCASYLANLHTKEKLNDAVNHKSSRNLTFAKRAGISAPVLALIVSVVVTGVTHFA